MRGSLILGAGPGGTGPLVWAAQHGALDTWLKAGVAIFDRGSAMGGTIGRYLINSDSLGTAYLECLDAPAARELFSSVRDDEGTRELETMRYALPPLDLVGRFLSRLGTVLEQTVTSYPDSEFCPQTQVRALHLRESGTVAAEVVSSGGDLYFAEAHSAVLALGGRQDMATHLTSPLLPGVRLGDVDLTKIIPSDALLSGEGLSRASQLLAQARSPRVVVLGGAHSAFSVLWVLTHLLPDVDFGIDDITLLYRRAARILYWTRDDAHADGYAFTERDVCPRTQRVNRLGGLRGDGREMWRRLTSRPGTEPEERISMIPLSESHLSAPALRRLLDDAALIIPAFGYRSSTIPIYDTEGRPLRLKADRGGPAVGRDARLLLADGGHIPNVFGIGLGADYRPWGHMGGEPSFDGQTNGLWLYQNDIGAVVYQGVRECIEEAERTKVSPRERVGSITAPKLDPVLEDALLMTHSGSAHLHVGGG
ncbi:MAG TPA: hypothetical protein VGB82_01150 [Alphaproteobacteria bacterium]